jgi:tRNA(Arg) A34 adenosine deaminase TadA
MPSPAQVARLLGVIEHEVAPLTRRGVARGNKIFGAAILRKADLSVVVTETNNEVENPLWHGEIHAIKRFHELPRPRPAPEKCLFLATHEPCSLCLSGITWAGFDNFSYLFSHQDSAEAFAIPHDIAILRAVYAVPDPDREAPAAGRDLYNRTNAYFVSTDLAAAVRELADEELQAQVERISRMYDELSAAYQAGKAERDIPMA